MFISCGIIIYNISDTYDISYVDGEGVGANANGQRAFRFNFEIYVYIINTHIMIIARGENVKLIRSFFTTS